MHPPTTTDRTAPDLHCISSAADRLGFSYRHVRRLIAQGRLDAQVVDRTRAGRPVWRISGSELARFEAERSAT